MNGIENDTVADGSHYNRDHLQMGTASGCFHCQAVFLTDEISQWIDNNRTALCPRCGIDAVSTGVTGSEALRVLHDQAFGRSTRPTEAEWDAASPAPPRVASR
jgi:hypothetical protein